MNAGTRNLLLLVGLAWLLSKKNAVVYPPAPDLPVQKPIPPNPLKNNPTK